MIEPTPKKQLSMQKLKDMGYPIAMIMFMLVILGLFAVVAQFLSKNIDAAISPPNEGVIQSQLMHINPADYVAIEQKLHLPPLNASSTEVLPTAETAMQPQTSSTPETSTNQPTVSKSALSLAVFNSTKKSGIASTIRNDLTAAGFTVAKTGNKTPQEPQTVVQIKEQVQANQAMLDEVLAIIGKRFTIGDPQILDGASPYDIVIIIGTK